MITHVVPQMGFPCGSVVKNLPANAEDGLDPWVRRNPWRRKWQPTPVLLPRKCHGQGSPVGYSPWGCKRVRHDLAIKQQCSLNNTTVLLPSSVGWWSTQVTLGKNQDTGKTALLFPRLFQILEVDCCPWRRALFSHLQSQQHQAKSSSPWFPLPTLRTLDHTGPTQSIRMTAHFKVS